MSSLNDSTVEVLSSFILNPFSTAQISPGFHLSSVSGLKSLFLNAMFFAL